MKRLIFTYIMLVCAVVSFAGTGKSLFVTFTDNTKVEFALVETPVVTVSDNSLVITTTSTKASYLLQKVSMFTYGTTTAIRTLPIDGVSITPNRIVFNGIAQQVRVFALDGSRVKTYPVVVNGSTIISLDNLPRGIYIISMNGKSFKIVRK
ncbi:MAG: hypothetical protein ACOYJK_09635 [Prevotella sp.]|jgi:hypothetical protein